MKTKIHIGLMVLGFNAVAQQNPTGSAPPPNTAPNVFALQNMVEKAWYRGGNLPGGSAGINNILGTMWNSPIYMQTDGGNRIQVSHKTFATPLQNYSGSLTSPLPGNRLTRVSISRDGLLPVTQPLSLLHLGYNSSVSGVAAGHRSWQDIGTMYMADSDNLYVGLRQKSAADATGRTSVVTQTPTDAQDAVISWGDNYSGNAPAPDDNLTFIFHAPKNNFFGLAGSDYGREVMRMNGDGNIGVGPVFFDNAKPQNMLHINNIGSNPAFLQISNQTGTGQTLADGFHIGVTATGVAQIIQKENQDMRFYTNNIQQAVIKNTGLVGFNTNNPGNEVEITSRIGNTGYGTANGSSGLRLTNLNSGATPLANPGTGVLSVNAQGDVIYVPSNGSASFGNICGNTANPLTNNWEIPLGGKNYVFTGNSLTGDRVGIGVTGCVPIAKLQVENTTGAGGAAIAGVFRNTGVNNSSVGYIGVLGTSNVTGTSLLGNVGGQFNASGAAINNIGAGATGTGGNNAFGVNGNASNGAVWSVAGKFDVINSTSPQNYGINSNIVGGTNTSSTNYGASFYNSNLGVTNIGVQGVAFNATNNYAIYGSVTSSSGTNPPTGPNYAGYFNGDVVRTGTDNFTSDLNLKQNLDTITNAMGIIAQLKPRSFYYQQSNYPSMNLPSGKQYGLIAQDVQLILPELVNQNVHPAVLDSAGNVIKPSVNFLSLEYQQFFGIILKGMQEQQRKIDSLITKTGKQDSINNAVQQQIAALASQINGCCSNANARHANTTINNQVDVELSDKDAIVLNQNVPNPFAEQTTITYNVPESVGKAQIIFYNSAGQIIQTVDVKTRGKGKINVFASDLSSGIYHYTLVADGKVIDSKKMMRE